MGELLSKSDINLSPEQLELLWRYHNLLRSRNQDRDLTRIVGFEPMVIKHYVDCLIVGKIWTIPTPLLDVGTGAGFPGIPLKIRYPNVHITLAEPRPRRVEFLKEAIETLKLSRTDVFDHKVVSRSFTTPVNGVITRALETMDKTLLRTSGCVQVGTQVAFMKGPNAGDELRYTLDRFGKHYKLALDREYRLPGTSHERRLIVLECTSVENLAN